MIVWVAGNGPNPLIARLRPQFETSNGRLLTDDSLRVLDSNKIPLDRIYALGDCSTLITKPLPATAQVANQQANYLAAVLNGKAKDSIGQAERDIKFSFKDRGMLAYVGSWRGTFFIMKR